MAVMGNIERDAAEAVAAYRRFERRVLADLHLPHGADPYASQAPAMQPVTVRATTHQEDHHMSLSADLHALASRLEPLGEEAVAKLEAVAANPATAEAFDLLHKLTGLGLDPALIGLAVGGLKAIVQAYEPPAQAAAA